jgi:disulfide bond formation protein DsbB
VIAAATLAGAWFFELVLDIRPCPLCLEQRYAYYLALPLGALVALAASRNVSRPVLVIGLAMLALAALGNAGLGAYHAGVEWKFWQGPTDCTGTIGNLGSAGNLSRAVAGRLQCADLAADGRDRGVGDRAIRPQVIRAPAAGESRYR